MATTMQEKPMARRPPVARVPGVALARALRALGLKQGPDFHIRAAYRRRERIGTYVVLIGSAAEIVLANQEKVVATTAADGGWWFRVIDMRDTDPDLSRPLVLITNEK